MFMRVLNIESAASGRGEARTRSRNMGRAALFRLFPSASLLVAHLGLNPVRVG